MIRKCLKLFRLRMIVIVLLCFGFFNFILINNGVTRHRRESPEDLFRHNPVSLVHEQISSTTVNNIILRFAEKHKLSVGLPPHRKWELGGYPALFNRKLVNPILNKYDVLCHHFRYEERELQRVTYPDSIYITILRDPADEFESGFWFFRDLPYTEWLPGKKTTESLQYFLNNSDRIYNHDTPWYFRAKNYQAFDLGFDSDNEDKKYIEEAIKYVNKTYHLVLLTEYFEESLILLKDLMCLEMNDLVHLRLKVRQNDARTNASAFMKQQMRTWNKLDSSIYKHFVKVLQSKINTYGRMRMKVEVEKLHNILNETEARCVREYDNYDLKPWISRIRLADHADTECQKLAWGEVKYGDYIRELQSNYVQINDYEQYSNDEQNRLLFEAQKTVLGNFYND